MNNCKVETLGNGVVWHRSYGESSGYDGPREETNALARRFRAREESRLGYIAAGVCGGISGEQTPCPDHPYRIESPDDWGL